MLNHKKPKVAFVSTYGCQCGIANFTRDLIENIKNVESYVLMMNKGWSSDDTRKDPVDESKIFKIKPYEKECYLEAAEFANKTVDVVNIQHEYGIFGGENGDYVISFMEKIKKPIVTTLHTVLYESATKQKIKVLKEIAKRSDAAVVISSSAAKTLTSYEVDARIDTNKMSIIPHGVHLTDISQKENAKKELGLENKIVMATFGLLSRGKGIEQVIEALPSVLDHDKNVAYLVLGVTHSKYPDKDYFGDLRHKINKLNLDDNVTIINNYLGLDEIKRYLQASDICITPYNSRRPDQVSSGCLSYGMAAGCIPLSTPYKYAREMIDNSTKNGLLVKFEDTHSISEAVTKLIKDKELKSQLASNAYNHARHMNWPDVAEQYEKLFCAIA